MKINQEKQLENRIKRLSNPKATNKSRISSTLILLFLFAGSLSLLAFQYAKNSKPVLSISSDKMNTIYIGIENPMTVAVENIPNEKIKVTSEDVELQPNGHGKFIITAKKEGKATITVSTNSFERAMIFNVEKVPSTKLGFNKPRKDGYSIEMTLEEFKGLKEFKTEFNETLGFDCEIVRFTLKRWVYGVDESVTIFNSVIDENPSFVREFMNTAKKGDHFSLKDVEAICPGDDEPRKIGGVSIRIEE
jgi:hypothetical protein